MMEITVNRVERAERSEGGRMEMVAKGEEKMEMGKNMPSTRLAVQFAQAFLKFDTWFESTRGLTHTPIGVISAEEGRYTNTQKI